MALDLNIIVYTAMGVWHLFRESENRVKQREHLNSSWFRAQEVIRTHKSCFDFLDRIVIMFQKNCGNNHCFIKMNPNHPNATTAVYIYYLQCKLECPSPSLYMVSFLGNNFDFDNFDNLTKRYFWPLTLHDWVVI